MSAASRFGATLAVTSSAWFLFALDRLVVITALPVRAGLGADLGDMAWTVDAYTLAFAVLLLAGAALGDRFGRPGCSPSGSLCSRPDPRRPRSPRRSTC